MDRDPNQTTSQSREFYHSYRLRCGYPAIKTAPNLSVLADIRSIGPSRLIGGKVQPGIDRAHSQAKKGGRLSSLPGIAWESLRGD